MLSDERIEELIDEIAAYFENETCILPSPWGRSPEEVVRAAIEEAVAAEREAHQVLVEHHRLHHQQQEIADMQMAALKRELEGEVEDVERSRKVQATERRKTVRVQSGLQHRGN